MKRILVNNKLLQKVTQLTSILVFVGCISPLTAQDGVSKKKYEMLNVYLDCSDCYEDYLRSEINFVNFVRNPSDASIHLLITDAGTASGGEEYTLKFIGKDSLQAQTDTLFYTSAKSDSDNEERAGLLRYVNLGLFPYLKNSSLINHFDLSFSPPDNESQQKNHDKWNNWVFETDVEVDYDAEEREQSYDIAWDLDATRVTPKWKIDLQLDYDIEKEKFKFDDKRDIISTSTSKSFTGFAAKSLGEHWSAGLTSRVASSSYNNIKLEAGASPTLEYNIFPYREYSRRELRIQYRVTPSFQQYRDTTIFNKKKERLLEQELEALFEITETWGSIDASLQGSHYMHDVSKNRLEFESSVEFRVYRGLSVDFGFEYSLINDQLSLSKQDLTEEEIILRQRALATDYSMSATIGVSYTFGSIYNNIVNPRMD
ncbi:hypothetical protein NC796_00905 [Aliifodinibius sp. S!AR15-10]|uniref:hypothetical protein n=1 Tax=Aliifodinibius sp. S!AR15-10 TaxID=2950437 RepID=UPI00285A7509|nr:hypothetical protein [Aliifodinibius sp. S!AR15-10]MDR8389674.1 hypothetical protein [Aliifodinibius sp. S!AR15-10]